MKTVQRSILGFFLAWTLTIQAASSNFKHITIDGAFDDWAGVPVAYLDPAFADDPTFVDNPAKFAGVTDLKAIYVAHDDQYLYVRFTLYAPGDPFTSRNNIFIDADNDSTTGFRAAGGLLGSEVLIQGGTGYQEKNGTFNDGS
ncbi:MAG: fibronectin, partial [Verrucomicrobiales bacterium]|nr:fibronectin [Verrucomicrobiales bacterium]